MLSRTAAALTISVLALSGCSGGSGPGPGALPTLSPTPSATPTLAPLPPAATAETPQGADAFVRYFFDQMNLAFREARPELITSLALASCATCTRFADSLDMARTRGEHFTGETFLITASAATAVAADKGTVTVAGRLPARDVLDSSGKVTRRLPDNGSFAYDVDLMWTRTSWLVSEITKVTR